MDRERMRSNNSVEQNQKIAKGMDPEPQRATNEKDMVRRKQEK